MPRSSRERPSHDRILSGAERLFAERGYGAVSLRDTIAAAGCSTTAFYARYPTKESVLEALLRGLLQELHDRAAEALPRASGIAEGFDVGIDVLVATIGDRKGLVRVMMTDGAAIPLTRDLLRDAYAGLADLLAAPLARVVPDPGAHAWALVGALALQVTRWAVFGDMEDQALADTLRATARTLLP